MKYRRHIFLTDKQKSEIWDRWQRGESMSSIGRVFDRGSSSILPLLGRTGGIRPRDRIRSRLSLTLIDREEISRGLRAQMSLRSIARTLKR
ncbi:helix-turn-helix domain-containing protein, partial [Sulfitobacter sp.]|uniref:helix-turn-helix domain-containing protein n=1 Tax=Sulfitobacter sp. TaxID=1903071 RepID=UPI003FCE56B1